MELKCLHCDEIFKKNDLDKTSKKELENYLREIEKSLYLKLKKELTKKHDEELKLVEVEKRKKYLEWKKLNTIRDDPESLERDQAFKYAILEAKQKKSKINDEVTYINVKIDELQKDFIKYSKLLEREKVINPMILFINKIKEIIDMELEYFDIDTDPYDAYFVSISRREGDKKFKEEFEKVFTRMKRLKEYRLVLQKHEEELALLKKTSIDDLMIEWGNRYIGNQSSNSWKTLIDILHNVLKSEWVTLCKDTIFEYLKLEDIDSFLKSRHFLEKTKQRDTSELIKYSVIFKTIPIIKHFEKKYSNVKGLSLIPWIEKIVLSSFTLKNTLNTKYKDPIRYSIMGIEKFKKQKEDYLSKDMDRKREIKELEERINQLNNEKYNISHKLFIIEKKLEKLKF